MIVIRNVFRLKFGQAREAVAVAKRGACHSEARADGCRALQPIAHRCDRAVLHPGAGAHGSRTCRVSEVPPRRVCSGTRSGRRTIRRWCHSSIRASAKCSRSSSRGEAPLGLTNAVHWAGAEGGRVGYRELMCWTRRSLAASVFSEATGRRAVMGDSVSRACRLGRRTDRAARRRDAAEAAARRLPVGDDRHPVEQRAVTASPETTAHRASDRPIARGSHHLRDPGVTPRSSAHRATTPSFRLGTVVRSMSMRLARSTWRSPPASPRNRSDLFVANSRRGRTRWCTRR